MVQTFPSTGLVERLRIVSAPFTLEPQQEVRRQGSGAGQARDLGPNLWVARVTSLCRTFRQLAEVQAMIHALNGAIEPFYLYNPFAAFPARDPGGTIIGSSTVSILSINADNKRLALQGLPVGYVLSLGDFLSFSYGSNPANVALHQIVEVAGVTANGSGQTTQFEVRPHIRAGAAVSDPVSLKKPAAMMKLVPGTVAVASGVNDKSITFTAEQHIRA